MSNQKKTTGLKHSFANRRFKSGAFSTILIVIVLAVVIFLNLMVQELKLQKDVSSDDMYTLTEDTKKLGKDLKDDIVIYYLVNEGQEYPVIERVLDQYDEMKHVKVVKKDPTLYPTFATKYTTEEIQQNDIIVLDKTNDKSKYVPFTDIYIENTDYTTYETSTSLDAEGQISAAINYVLGGVSAKMYVVSGHNEVELGPECTKMIEKCNVQMEDLPTLTTESIPEDCDILMINGPTSDLTEGETQMIQTYLENGGKGFFCTQYSGEKMENYYSILNYYGAEVQDGVVLETKGNYLSTYATYVIPSMSTTSEITSEIDTKKLMITPIAQGLKQVADARGTLALESVLSTSEGSYAKINTESDNAEMEDGDIAGPFDIAIAATDTYKDYTTKVLISSGVYMLADDWMQGSNFANGEVIRNSLQWMTGATGSGLSIPARSLDQPTVTVNNGQKAFYGILFVAVIPILLLCAGFIIWYVRRRH